jgi:hypothetical protein
LKQFTPFFKAANNRRKGFSSCDVRRAFLISVKLFEKVQKDGKKP